MASESKFGDKTLQFFRYIRNVFAVIIIVITVSSAIANIRSIPNRVFANEIKNKEQDEALTKLLNSLHEYTTAQNLRNEGEKELRKRDMEMRELLIEMIRKNTDLIIHGKRGR